MAQNYTNFSVETESTNETELSSCSPTKFKIHDNGTGLEFSFDMQYKDIHRFYITGFSLLLFFSAVGNIYVLISHIRRNTSGKRTRIDLLFLHLTIADLLVTFVMMPLQIGWKYNSGTWKAGDVMCRLMVSLQIFGWYLNGFVIVVISLDLYFAVVRPLGIAYAEERAKIMLAAAWLASFICSLPQPFVWHVEKFDCFEVCTVLNSYPSKMYAIAYDAFVIFFFNLLPLSIIVFCYASILFQIYQVNKNSQDYSLGRSNANTYCRARTRTLKISVTIVTTFFVCWAPWSIKWLWYWIDSKSLDAVDVRIHAIIFMCIGINSLLNPIIYGYFHVRKNTKQRPVKKRFWNFVDAKIGFRKTDRKQNGNGKIDNKIAEDRKSGVEISDISVSRISDTNTHTSEIVD